MVYAIGQFKAQVGERRKSPTLWRSVGSIGISLGALTLAACGSIHTEASGEQQGGASANSSSKIITTKFNDIISEFASNEVAALRKYANARIRTKDYISSINQDSDGAYASLDGGIHAYGSADVLAALHRGDEVQVTCDSASRFGYVELKNCDIEVLHPEGGFDSETGSMAMVLDGNGGAYVAGLHRDDTQSATDATSKVESGEAASPSPN